MTSRTRSAGSSPAPTPSPSSTTAGRALLDRAARLRELALDHDQVVLHVHPNDVVPAIALALPPGERPEVLLVNHADHVFWVGVHVADRIVNLRTSGARLNVERRGIPEARNALLVRPLVMRDRSLSRSAARAELGPLPDALVVASAADTYKYGAAGGETLLDVLLPVMRAHPEARLHVAGPEPDGDWSALAAEGLGRAWGLLPDVHTLLEAADVYVDSHPFSSLTSMLEAAWLDTPVLTLRSPDERLGVLGADTPELDDDLVVAGSGQELGAEVDRLLADADARHRVGASTGAAVRRFHADGAWAELAGKILDAPPAAGPASAPGAAVREHGAARPAAAAGDGQRRRPGAGRDARRRVTAAVVAAPRRDRGPAAAHRPGASAPCSSRRGAASRIRQARTAVGSGAGALREPAHRAGEADEQEEAARGLREGERVEEGQPARAGRDRRQQRLRELDVVRALTSARSAAPTGRASRSASRARGHDGR